MVPKFSTTQLEWFFYATNRNLFLIFISMTKKDLSFLDNVGVSKLEFTKTTNVLEQLAGEFVDEAQKNLNATNSNSSGSLSNSLEVQEPVTTESTMRVDVTMLIYGKFINKGVKGIVGGSGLYSFKNLYPSKLMISSLMASKSKAQSKTSSTNTKKTISQNEKKNANISQIGSAWGAAVNIKKFGIKPTGFIDKSVISIMPKVKNELGKAFKIDIITSMEKL